VTGALDPARIIRVMDADPRAWRPQAFGHRHFKDVPDPVIEPAWDGVRVLAHLDAAAAHAAIRDAAGADLTPDHAPIADALLAALRADTVVVDGYLTDQATRTREGRTILASEIPSFSEQASQFFLGRQGAEIMSGRGRPDRTGRTRIVDDQERALENAPIAFVAVDLVELDGQPLVEIPLLERKRLLESVLAEGDLVRRTPYVRQPAGTFIVTWRSFGFGGLAYKAANSRYLPGAPNDDWCMTPMPRR
jgi:bifunctional non-homologous end joining protein LigD